MSDASEKISGYRGDVISTFAAMEVVMTEYIAHKYAPNHEQQLKLMNDILDHKFFGFELKKAIFYKILADENITDFPKNKLEKMQDIRNIVAHGAIAVDSPEDFHNIAKIYIQHAGKKHNAVALLRAYSEFEKIVRPIIFKLSGMPFVGE